METEKLSYDQLIDILAAARKRVEPGTKWRHYKGREYIVENIVIIEATNEVSVLYNSATQPQVSFVRPITSWLETVERNGEALPRFAKLY